MKKIKIQSVVEASLPAFRDRADAGRRLAEYMELNPCGDSLVLALPRGGIPVGEPVAEALGAPLAPVFVRKLPLPDSPEMGFGAAAIDGTYILNGEVVTYYGIHEDQVMETVKGVVEELKRRASEYDVMDPPSVRDKDVFFVDDGLATGYTMMAAVEMADKSGPRSITVCVPVSPLDSLKKLSRYVQLSYCLYAQDTQPFAVASFYRDFHDLSDEEVRDVLERRRALL